MPFGDTFVEATTDTSLTSHTPTGSNPATAWVTCNAGVAATVIAATDDCRDNNTANGNRFKITDDLGTDEMDVQLDVSFTSAALTDLLFAGPTGRHPNATSGTGLGVYEFNYDWSRGTNGTWSLGDQVVEDTLDEAYPGGSVTMLLQLRSSDVRGFAGGVEKVSLATDEGAGNQFAGAMLGNFEGNGSKRSRMDNFNASAAATGTQMFLLNPPRLDGMGRGGIFPGNRF